MASKEDQDRHVQSGYEVARDYKLKKAQADAKMWEDLANEYKAKIRKLEDRVKELETNTDLIYREAVVGTLFSVKHLIRKLNPNKQY